MNWEKREPKMIFKVPFTIDQTQKSSLINMALKPISMILALVYTPLLLSYLGDEKYGLWSTVISVISWINYCDIGIGQGLRNLLSKELTQKQIEKAKKSEEKTLPADLDYSKIEGLRLEAREKLQRVRPLNLGQAERISGVNPADIAVLTVYLSLKK